MTVPGTPLTDQEAEELEREAERYGVERRIARMFGDGEDDEDHA